MKKTFLLFFTLFVFFLGHCSNQEDVAADKTGRLNFAANGEDFIREGFTSEDGWDIEFEHFYVNVAGLTAFALETSSVNAHLVAQPSYNLASDLIEQMQPSYHAGHDHAAIPSGSQHATLGGVHFIDLVNSLNSDGMVTLGQVNAKVGNYNRVNFNLANVENGATGTAASYVGYNLVIIGTATKPDQGNTSLTDTVNFTLQFSMGTEYTSCGPNGNAGVLGEDGSARAEITFHADHIFGDVDEGDPDSTNMEDINFTAVGFGPFARHSGINNNNSATDTVPAYVFKQGEQSDVNAFIGASGNSAAVYVQLVNAVRGFGHSGEGHCSYN